MLILRVLDSAFPPSKTQIAEAKAAGYGGWLGYFAGPNILNGWSDQHFLDVLEGGLGTGAYCSGWADPVACKTRAEALGIRPILDDESGIRSIKSMSRTALRTSTANRTLARSMFHGGQARPVLEFVNGLWRISSWVQPWLDASGGALYGNQPVFAGAHAAAYVFAGYPGGDPGVSWPTYYPRPLDGNPCGWQYEGTHIVFGIGVDASNFDDNFFGLHGGGGQVVTAKRRRRRFNTMIFADGKIAIVGVAADQQLWCLRWDLATWTSKVINQPNQKFQNQEPLIEARPGGMDVYVLGLEGAAYHTWSTDEGVTFAPVQDLGGNWLVLGGGMSTAPLAAAVTAALSSGGVGDTTALSASIAALRTDLDGALTSLKSELDPVAAASPGIAAAVAKMEAALVKSGQALGGA